MFIGNGTVEIHARTNALGFPLRVGGGVMGERLDGPDRVAEEYSTERV